MTYSEKLRSPLWQKKRLQILERDGWACKSCGSTTKNLQVHHIIYAHRDPWDYPDDSYQTLCDACHRERQQIADDASNALKMALSRYPTAGMEMVKKEVGRYSDNSDDGRFRQMVVWNLHEAFDLSLKNGCKIRHGLFSDAVLGLLMVQITGNHDRAIKILKMVITELEALNEPH